MKKISLAIAISSMIILPATIACTEQPDQTITEPDQNISQSTDATSPSTDADDIPDATEPGSTSTNYAEPNRNATNSEDSPFMMAAAQGGMAEVTLGQMAQEKASSDQVRQFAQQMVEDHSQANDQLMQLFQQKGITPPDTIGARYGAIQEQLEDLSGEEFDQEYMSQMVDDHQEDVSMFQKEVETGQDPEVQAWASQTLPSLQSHLQQAQSVNQSLTGGGGSTSSGS